ncbi:ComEC/Rec2 family competence protein [Paenibacillus sp. UNC499MF]|uniref:ComEC/Rec2 family competence protein n=1 Tax=Paenibacillus sp. UNC499MF TaxID=1502751 RepID=UPI0008A079F9|nr:ComEC/Rec2 family competence protein [Paenibacillus sp. UNC499MF]SEF48019.1 competence protein ComEC [Paenibacillus sp. UNC499MF]
MRLNRNDITGLSVLWVIGYAAAIYASKPWMTLWSGAAFAAAAAGVMALRLPKRRWIAAALVVAAACCYYADTDRRNSTALPAASAAAAGGSQVSVAGTLASPVAVDGDRASFELRVSQLGESGGSGTSAAGGAPPEERVQVSLRLLSPAEQTAAASWRRGDRLAVRGELQEPAAARNFGGFDYRRYLRQQGKHWLLVVKGAQQVQHGPPASLSAVFKSPRLAADRLLRTTDALRGYLGSRIDRIFTPGQAGFMKSMLIGLTDDMDPDRYGQFSNLGLTHILAISGLNVAVFLGVLIWVLKRLGLPKETYLLVAVFLLPLYILLTGASPSIVRAGLMTMIGLLAVRKNRIKDILQIACLVGLGLLIWNPYYLLDVSFQLSFLVTIGLIVGVPRVTALLPLKNGILRNTAAITLVSQLVSFPVSIYYFNQFSLLSWLANAALVPVFSLLIFPAGLIATFLGLLYVPIGRLGAWVTETGTGFVFSIVEWLDRWEGFRTIWPSPSFFWIAAYYILLAGICLVLERLVLNRRVQEAEEGPRLDVPASGQGGLYKFSKSPAAVITLGFCWIGLLFYGYTPDRWSTEAYVDMIDVGQGDSILIRTPARRYILVDGGGTVTFRKPGEEWKLRRDPYEVGRKTLVPLLKKRGVHKLDAVILTHEDADHSGGLQAVLEDFPVETFIFNGTYKSGPQVEKLFRTVVDKKIPLISAAYGKTLRMDSRTRLDFLAPQLPAGTHSPPDEYKPGEAAFPAGKSSSPDTSGSGKAAFPVQPTEGKAEAAPAPPPARDASGSTGSPIVMENEQNGVSVVFLLEMDGTRWLFTGDMDVKAERRVLELLQTGNSAGEAHETKPPQSDTGTHERDRTENGSPAPAGIDVLKVAHHGSKTSTGSDWLGYWKPRTALISAGVKNMYRHPSPDVVARLERNDIRVLRTDLLGEIQLLVKRGKIYVRSMLSANSSVPVDN